MNRSTVVVACGLILIAAPVRGEEKPTLELKLVPGKDSYAWPYAQGPKEFAAALQELLHAKKKGQDVRLPAPPSVDVVLRITNIGKETATIYVGGDANVFTLTVRGPGIAAVAPGLAVTTEFRMPRSVTLEPGNSHEIPVRQLADGPRGVGRYFYVTAPGEYTLTATYQLATEDGGKGLVLKSGATTIKFAGPKK